MKNIIMFILRTATATGAGVGLSNYLQNDYGMILTPLLLGLSKTIKKYYENKNKELTPQDRYPWWVVFLPV